MRKSKINRKTNETSISIKLNLDGKGNFKISTGIGFLDLMLEQLSNHSLIDINLQAIGDLKVDDHHTTEDTGIALGEAITKALGNKKSIRRFGTFYIPMDETLTRVSLDLSNRPYLIWKVKFTNKQIGKMESELFKEWFQAFSQSAGMTLHIENLYGDNNHHIIETCFKGLARSLREAISIDPREKGKVPSTKGKL